MSENISYNKVKLTNEQFKNIIGIVTRYQNQGGEDGQGNVSPNRPVYVNYPNTDKYIVFEKYMEMKDRWDNFITTNRREPSYIWIVNELAAVDVSNEDRIWNMDTILDLEIRVNQYKMQNAEIADNRRVYLKMVEMREYITYSKYKEIMSRVNVFRATNGRNPNFVYNIAKTNTNSSRPNAVGDDITPNNDGWYMSQRYKSAASSIKQETNYWCGPNSVQQVWYELTGVWHKESEIAKYAGTTTSGTGHNGLDTAVKKLANIDGKKVSISWKYLSDLGYTELAKLVKSLKNGVYVHSKYKLKWGHYEYVVGVNPITKKVLVANSLSGGWLEYRSFATMNSYVAAISQKSVCDVTLLS